MLIVSLILIALWAISADKLMIFFPENRLWHRIQIVSLHEMSKPVFCKKSEKYFKILSAKMFTQHSKCKQSVVS